MKNLLILMLAHCAFSIAVATTHDVFLVGANCCDTVYTQASLGDTVFVLTNSQFGLPYSITSPDFERAGLGALQDYPSAIDTICRYIPETPSRLVFYFNKDSARYGETVWVVLDGDSVVPPTPVARPEPLAGKEGLSLTWVSTNTEHRAAFKSPVAWVLYDFRGRKVNEGIQPVITFTLDRSQLPSGVYFIYYKGKNRDAIHKFLN